MVANSDGARQREMVRERERERKSGIHDRSEIQITAENVDMLEIKFIFNFV